jgi:hypothetical protein
MIEMIRWAIKIQKSCHASQPDDSARALGYSRVVFMLQIALCEQATPYCDG